MVETFGFEGLGINVWLVWILPFVGAAIIAGVARVVSSKATNYAAVGFALASAISATTLIPIGLAGEEIHSQISWISSINRSEEHTSELQSQSISYAVFCLKKKKET